MSGCTAAFVFVLVGPITHTEDGQTTLVGLVSWGYGCAQVGSPGIYARVSRQIEWIKNITEGNILFLFLENA